MTSPAAKLRRLLAAPGILPMPCCFDALSARLIEQAGFPLTFMSGFAVSATKLGLPDTGLISYGEMVDQGRNITAAVSIPVIGDGDTGYGNPVNVQRTVRGYGQAGFACVMIEDQLAPKRCGHTDGKQVVERGEAIARIRAAVEARDAGADILIMARTDARATHGLDEAIQRCQEFAAMGADLTFLEAPRSEEEMRRYCDAVAGPKMVNLLEQGETPLLPLPVLAEMGFAIAAWPLTLLNVATHAMQQALAELAQGRQPEVPLSFAELRRVVGFDDYHAMAARFADNAKTD